MLSYPLPFPMLHPEGIDRNILNSIKSSSLFLSSFFSFTILAIAIFSSIVGLLNSSLSLSTFAILASSTFLFSTSFHTFLDISLYILLLFSNLSLGYGILAKVYPIWLSISILLLYLLISSFYVPWNISLSPLCLLLAPHNPACHQYSSHKLASLTLSS